MRNTVVLSVGESITALLGRHRDQLDSDALVVEASTRAAAIDGFTVSGFGAVFVEVGVDPDLGEIRVRRVGAAFCAGRIINRTLTTSQYTGGLIAGIGMALHERTITDETTGRIIGDGFADYLIPVHADMPEFDIAIVEEPDPHIPGGTKGVGMLGTAGIQAAIANAIHHAIGCRVRHLPIRL